MRVLIEQYAYDVESLEPGLRKIGLESNGKIALDEVGYYLNSDIKDCVFILPKVILWLEKDAQGNVVKDENGDPVEKVLGKYSPEEFIRPDKLNLSAEERGFIYGFSTWIYRALCVYNKTNPKNGIVFERHTPHVSQTGKRRKSETLLDVLLSIQDFAKDNQDFFFFTVRNRHSGFNKINWSKTVSKTAAAWQDNSPVYVKLVNKRREIDFDEELLVIFFSILNHMKERYGFNVKIDLGYELITGGRFQSYIEKGMGKRRLLAIKYKYFSDRALRLWDLCYAFFDLNHGIYLSGDHEEYLLARSFDRVFEAMIDELVGDRKTDLPRSLVNQDDGKRVDHMYLWKELMENPSGERQIFYIGDSKYYKYNTPVGREAVYKQFTYAKNVIQWHLDLFLDESGPDADREEERQKYAGSSELRDKVTEGYNIVPNFFISAMMSSDLRGGFLDDSITQTSKGKKQFFSRQFENRIFDRDTLIVAHYDVNFLFIISLYAQENAYRKAAWKGKVREQFRNEIRKLLTDYYDFYAMTPRLIGHEEEFLKSDFAKILGKVYKPFGDVDGRPYYSLALERADPAKDNADVKAWLERCFIVEPCALGEDPVVKLQGQVAALHGAKAGDTYSEANVQETVLFGTCRGKDQLDFIASHNVYHMSLENAKRFGVFTKEDAASKKVLYIMPTMRGGDTLIHRFRITRFSGEVSKANIIELGWSSPSSEKYWLWNVEPLPLASTLMLEQDESKGAP